MDWNAHGRGGTLERQPLRGALLTLGEARVEPAARMQHAARAGRAVDHVDRALQHAATAELAERPDAVGGLSWRSSTLEERDHSAGRRERNRLSFGLSLKPADFAGCRVIRT